MAEIPIERKRGTAIWPWIIALLIVLLLLWFFFWRHRDGTSQTARADSAAAVATSGSMDSSAGALGATDATGAPVGGGAAGANASASSAVSAFTTFVANTSANTDEGKQHAYTAGGVTRLADALAALGASGAPLDNMRKQATALESSSAQSTHHADMARSAFRSAADAFSALKAKYPTADVGRVRSTADAMKDGPHLLEQKDKIQAFFDASRDALQAMTKS